MYPPQDQLDTRRRRKTFAPNTEATYNLRDVRIQPKRALSVFTGKVCPTLDRRRPPAARFPIPIEDQDEDVSDVTEDPFDAMTDAYPSDAAAPISTMQAGQPLRALRATATEGEMRTSGGRSPPPIDRAVYVS